MTTEALPVPEEAPRADRTVTTVGVLGACMTRDPFNRRFTPDYQARYRLGPVGFRSALPSVMSAPLPLSDEELGEISAGSGRIARRDFGKAFVTDIAAEPPDILLVDFSADVDLGVVEIEGGRYVTWNEWQLRRSPWLRDRTASGRLATLRPFRPADRGRYLELWLDAFERLTAHLRSVAPDVPVVLIRARQERLLWLPDRDETVPLHGTRWTPPGDPDVKDEVWAMLDEEALRRTGWRSIDLRGRAYPTSDRHPWDAGPLHYAPEYYADLLAGLDAILEELRGGPAAPEALLRPTSPVLGRRWDGEPGAGEFRPRPPSREGGRLRWLPYRRQLAQRVVRPLRAARARVGGRR